MHEMMDKLQRIRAAIDKSGRDIELSVDGGIDLETAPIAAAHGANFLVSGSGLFGTDDYTATMQAMRESAQRNAGSISPTAL